MLNEPALQVSANYNQTFLLSNTTSYQVANITASIELDTGPTYANNFLVDNRETW